MPGWTPGKKVDLYKKYGSNVLVFDNKMFRVQPGAGTSVAISHTRTFDQWDKVEKCFSGNFGIMAVESTSFLNIRYSMMDYTTLEPRHSAYLDTINHRCDII